MKGKIGLAAATVCASLVVGVPTASAADGRAWRGEDFVHRYDRRMLDTTDGATAEYTRLKRAVRRYCRTANGMRSARWNRMERDCRNGVMAECEKQMPKQIAVLYRQEFFG